MEYSFKLILLSIMLPFMSSIMLKVNGDRASYCFSYSFFVKTELKVSYAIASEKEEELNVTITNNKKTVLYEKSLLNTKRRNNTQSDKTNFVVEENSNIELCFYPKPKREYSISFDLIISFMNENLANLGTDEGMKNVLKDVKEIKSVFDELETQLKFSSNGKFKHLSILKGIIRSIKLLSYLKIGMYLIFSILQGVVIIKFFGPDKRVSKVAGAFKTEGL